MTLKGLNIKLKSSQIEKLFIHKDFKYVQKHKRVYIDDEVIIEDFLG